MSIGRDLEFIQVCICSRYITCSYRNELVRRQFLQTDYRVGMRGLWPGSSGCCLVHWDACVVGTSLKSETGCIASLEDGSFLMEFY